MQWLEGESMRFEYRKSEGSSYRLFTTGLINRQDSNVGRTHTYIMDVCSRSVKYYTSDTDHSSGFGHNIVLLLFATVLMLFYQNHRYHHIFYYLYICYNADDIQ
ncbi:hypothetical protein KSF78_0002919 [Schistosoma japonicum]|nr:hypothetical protein KSF78_0002919 [Schistosoma japonicum]